MNVQQHPLDAVGGMTLDLQSVVDELRQIRARWRSGQGRNQAGGPREFPSREVMRNIVQKLVEALFPMRLGPSDLRRECEDYFVGHALYTATEALVGQVELELLLNETVAPGANRRIAATELVREFAAALPKLRILLDEDVLAAFLGDPAARSVDEILLCYPGMRALMHFRIASELYRLGAPVLARLVSETAHSETGIDIHPGAQIGHSFFIDHGTGVVIGETTVIGDRVRLYQAVTLGAKRIPAGQHPGVGPLEPRHPIVEDDVVIYAGASLLGRITIGHGSVIGGNVWLTHSVPPGSHITQASIQGGAISDIGGLTSHPSIQQL